MDKADWEVAAAGWSMRRDACWSWWLMGELWAEEADNDDIVMTGMCAASSVMRYCSVGCMAVRVILANKDIGYES